MYTRYALSEDTAYTYADVDIVGDLPTPMTHQAPLQAIRGDNAQAIDHASVQLVQPGNAISSTQQTDQTHGNAMAQPYAQQAAPPIPNQQHTGRSQSSQAPRLHTRAQQLQVEAGCRQHPSSSGSVSHAVDDTQHAGSGCSSAACNEPDANRCHRSRSCSAPCSDQVAQAYQVAGQMAQCLQPSSDSLQLPEAPAQGAAQIAGGHSKPDAHALVC